MRARAGVAACSAAVVLGLSHALHLGRSNCSDDEVDEHQYRLSEPKYLPRTFASCMAPPPPEVYDMRPPLWYKYQRQDPGTKCSDHYDFAINANRSYSHVKEAECTGDATAPMGLSVFWSVGPGALSGDVVREQLDELESSGLGAEAKSVKLATRDHYGNDWRGRFRSDFVGNGSAYSWSSKVEDIRLSSSEDEDFWAGQQRHYEFYALEGLWDHCHQSPTPSSEAVLYIHTKAGQRAGPGTKPDMSGTKRADWRRLVQYFSLQRYKDCVDHLKCGYSTCGSLLVSPDRPRFSWPHYSGNVWWARCDYIRALPRPRPHPTELNQRDLIEQAASLDPPQGHYKAEWWLLGSLRDYSRDRVFKNCWGSTSAEWKTVSGCKDCWKCWISWGEVAAKSPQC